MSYSTNTPNPNVNPAGLNFSNTQSQGQKSLPDFLSSLKGKSSDEVKAAISMRLESKISAFSMASSEDLQKFRLWQIGEHPEILLLINSNGPESNNSVAKAFWMPPSEACALISVQIIWANQPVNYLNLINQALTSNPPAVKLTAQQGGQAIAVKKFVKLTKGYASEPAPR